MKSFGKIKDSGLSVRKVEKLVKKYLTSGSDIHKAKGMIRKVPSSANLGEVEDRLRKLFATKVICRQKPDGSGEITIEFYSNEELERLYELFDAIDKSYS